MCDLVSMVFCSNACTQASAVAWCLFVEFRHSSIMYAAHYPWHVARRTFGTLSVCKPSHRLLYSFPVWRCPDVHVVCTMSCHYLSCRCLGNHTGSRRPHHSDISIHTGYMILACQLSVVLASILRVVVRVSKCPEEIRNARFVSAQTAVKRPTAGTYYYSAAQLC